MHFHHRTSRPAAPEAVPLTVVDRLCLETARRHVDSAQHLGALLSVPGPPPALDALVTHVEERVRGLPDLTYRLTRTGGKACWEPDPGFDVSRQLHVVPAEAVPAGGTDAVLSFMLDRPLPRDRPLWGVWLVHRTDGRYAICYRAHHAFQDGSAARATVEGLFGLTGRRGGAGSLMAGGHRIPDKRLLSDLVPPFRRTSRWSVLDGPFESRYEGRTADADIGRLHRIGRTTRASLTQICLALTADTLRGWRPEEWEPPGAGAGRGLRANLALSVRAPDEAHPLLGNRVAVMTVPLPCQEASPLRRLELLRNRVAHDRMTALAAWHRVLLRRTPYWLGRLALARHVDTRYTPLSVADIRPRVPLGFDGTPADSVHALPVMVPNQPVFVSWVVTRTSLHVSFCTDTAVPGTERLPALWEAAIDRLEDAAGSC